MHPFLKSVKIMKRYSLIITALLVTVVSVSARDYYNHSVGIMAGSTYGFTYKGYVFSVDGLALLADAHVNLISTVGSGANRYSGYSARFDLKNADLMTFQLNPNIIYQQRIKSWRFGAVSWYAGGGISGGIMMQLNRADIRMVLEDGKGPWVSGGVLDMGDKNTIFGKAGVNAVGGAELYFTSVPLVLDLDFRPGFGTAFRRVEVGEESCMINVNFFDWALAASLRYRF